MKKQIRRFAVLFMICMIGCITLHPVKTEAKGVKIDTQVFVQDYLKSSALQAKPYFESGGSTHTHQYIVSQALAVLKHDQGDSILTDSSYANTLKSYTDWPDVFGNETDTGTFAGHFYNPNTEKNWLGSKSKTAMTRATGYFNEAVTAAKQGNMDDAIVMLGKGSHYVSDMNEPHHASNLTAINSNHSAFEKYVDENNSCFYIAGNTLNNSYYTEAKQVSMYQILKNGAFHAYSLKDMAQDENTYYQAGELSVKHAIVNMVQYIYAFGVETGIYA